MDKNTLIGVSQFTEQKNCDTPILYFKKKLKEVYDTEKKKYESPEEVQVLKILISTGDSYFKI